MALSIGTEFAAASPDYIAVTTSSQQFTLTLDASIQYVFTSDVACYLKVAANPTASAADGNIYVPAGTPWPLASSTAAVKVAVIGVAAGVATLSKLVTVL